jgi:hypothetical protein
MGRVTGDVKVAASSIARAWRDMGGGPLTPGDDVWLRLVTKHGSSEDFAVAVDDANQAAIARGEGDEAYGESPTETIGGFVVQLKRATTLDAVRGWVADLATGLRERGFSGRIGGTGHPPLVPCLQPSRPPIATGFAAWTLDTTAMDDEPCDAAGWLVDPQATERIAQLLDRWARRPGALLILRQNIHSLVAELDDAAPHLASSVTATGLAGLDFIIDKERSATHTALAFGGDGVFQIVDDQLTWEEVVEALTTALTALPADTNHAYIRTATRNLISHSEVAACLPLPGIAEWDVRYNKHLLDRHLPDAHGVQVVRTAHLERARDLSSWRVTDLGHGRHLVRAHDLAPWFEDALPTADVLARAREDFAGALLTPRIIVDNPPASGPTAGTTMLLQQLGEEPAAP